MHHAYYHAFVLSFTYNLQSLFSRCKSYLQVFDAYAQFEESMLSAKMETTSEMGSTEEGDYEIK